MGLGLQTDQTRTCLSFMARWMISNVMNTGLERLPKNFLILIVNMSTLVTMVSITELIILYVLHIFSFSCRLVLVD